MFSSDFKKVLPYALVAFLGYVGFSMPLPILPKMFLDPHVGIIKASFSESLKTFLLGLIMSAYPAGQLIGSPILGKLSDQFGRKKILLFSLFGCTLGYIVTALAVKSHSIPAIFSGLFFTGLCEGNIAIAQSVVADLAGEGEERKKTIYFGWINLFVCFAFIVGPILGGQLSDTNLVKWFTFSTPFWLASVMTCLSIGIVYKFSKETRSLMDRCGSSMYFKSFKEGFSDKRLCRMYLVNFFLALGYFSYFRYLPVYFQARFAFSSVVIGYTIAYGSVIYALAAFFLLKPLSKAMTPVAAVSLFAAVLGVSMVIVLMPGVSWGFFFTTIPANISLAVVMTYGAVIVSNVAPLGIQGQALGVLTSVQVIAETLTGVGGGLLAGYKITLPILTGSLMLIVASLILFAFRKKNVDDASEV